MPVLTARPVVWISWKQHHPGGCRCACRFFHPDAASGGGSVCLSAAQPGLLIRIEAGDGRREGPLPVCEDCYDALAAQQKPG